MDIQERAFWAEVQPLQRPQGRSVPGTLRNCKEACVAGAECRRGKEVTEGQAREGLVNHLGTLTFILRQLGKANRGF